MMTPQDLQHKTFSKQHLKHYENRAVDFSGQFLRWFLEHILRLDPLEADDAAVDAKHDKGVDAIYVDDVSETLYVIQSKTKTNPNASLGDTELKAFVSTLVQFNSDDSVYQLSQETNNQRLKQALERHSVRDKIKAGYNVQGMFITNVPANADAKTYLIKTTSIDLYDAVRIATEYVDLEVDGGISGDFFFDISDTDVIGYDAGGAATRIFLAPALNLIKMEGITDGRLFEQNVRLSLGNTKVNRSLRDSIRNKSEHLKFPLYHNGINVLCSDIISENDQKIFIKNYVVVNGAQSLTSLMTEKSKLSDDLKILVKLIEVKGDIALSQAITRNSNNQNAIKARDLKSNHNIQQRIKKEVEIVSNGCFAYEIKQGENNKGKTVISNEIAGLIILAMDLGQPWNCHQKYKVMDELHSNIFGRPGVTGGRVLALWEAFQATKNALSALDDAMFAYYSLTQYFIAYAVALIVRSQEVGANVMSNLELVVSNGNLKEFCIAFSNLATAVSHDLNAEVMSDNSDDDYFDYKNSLKSAKWRDNVAKRLLAQYNKDVLRKKADPIEKIFNGIC